MEEIFALKYDGLSAALGEMDAYDLADALRGFADFSRRISEGLYGGKMEIRTAVRDLRHGSIEVEFLHRFLSPDTAAILAPLYEHLPHFIEIVKECIELFKHLQGERPAKIRKADNGGVYIENNYGTVINVNQSTANLVLNEAVGRAAQNFIGRPLARSASDLTIKGGADVVANINKQEAKYFIPIDGSNILTEHVSDVYLTVVTTVFEGVSRWKFFDGRNTFSAKIEDQTFLNRVEKGEERFGRGDALYVRLRSTQKRVNGALKAEYVVEEVLEHVPTLERQGRLL